MALTELLTEVEDNDVPRIEKTMEYDEFKTMEGNRSISESHVNNLMDFIKRRNLLKYNPILVNDQYQVIDGQHRLEAAKGLQIPIYYIVGEGVTYKDAGILNACSDDWEFREYLEMYVKNGHEEYIKLTKFKTENNLSLKRFQFLMSKDQKKIFDEKFKIGTFHIVDDLEKISDKIRKINDIVSFLERILVTDSKRFLYTDNFWRALYQFLITMEVDIERFKDKLGFKFQSIRQMSGYKDYVRTFIDIYNWKSKANKVS